MDDEVPLVVSQVNPEDLDWHKGIIANPNCSTMQVAPLLAALRDAVGLRRVIVDTYQSVSGTGSDAIEEMEAQVRARVAGEAPVASVYPHPIAFNALPEIDTFMDNGYTKEEWKVVTESRKILHLPDLPDLVHGGHGCPCSSATRKQSTSRRSGRSHPREARAAFAATPGVVVVDDPAAHRYPLAMDAAGRDEIFVGRVRADISLPDGRGLASGSLRTTCARARPRTPLSSPSCSWVEAPAISGACQRRDD